MLAVSLFCQYLCSGCLSEAIQVYNTTREATFLIRWHVRELVDWFVGWKTRGLEYTKYWLLITAGLEFHLSREQGQFHFGIGHFHQKVWKSIRKFWRGTKANTRTNREHGLQLPPHNYRHFYFLWPYWCSLWLIIFLSMHARLTFKV